MSRQYMPGESRKRAAKRLELARYDEATDLLVHRSVATQQNALDVALCRELMSHANWRPCPDGEGFTAHTAAWLFECPEHLLSRRCRDVFTHKLKAVRSGRIIVDCLHDPSKMGARARATRPDWMLDPSRLPKAPPGRAGSP